MAYFIPHSALEQVTRLLSFQNDLYGVQTGNDGVARYKHLNNGATPDFSALRTLLPPKKFLFHPHESVLRYNPEQGYHEPHHVVTPWILLGIHPCDLAAIAYLDKLLLGDSPDSLYAARRNALTLIGMSCTPDSYCSCEVTTSNLPAPCDVYLTVMPDGWNVTAHSDRGLKILELLQPVLQQKQIETAPDTRRFFGQPKNTPKEPDRHHQGWQLLADACLGCGACSVTCPTCSCFDISEQSCLDEHTVNRMRRWDNCLRAGHSRVAGAGSFQKKRRERFQYRYRHKYLGFGPLAGTVSCTGCGRCSAFCPAHLDLRLLAKEVSKETP